MARTGWYVPRRGDIVWVEFGPVVGHEQSGHRPAVVLSVASYIVRTGLSVVCPITDHPKGYEHEVPIPDGLPVSGVVLCDHVRSLDIRARGAQFLCQAPSALMTAVLTGVLKAVR